MANCVEAERRGHSIFITLAANRNSMIEEEENQFEAPEAKRFSGQNLNRIIAILFVLGLHLVILLKILVLE